MLLLHEVTLVQSSLTCIIICSLSYQRLLVLQDIKVSILCLVRIVVVLHQYLLLLLLRYLPARCFLTY